MPVSAAIRFPSMAGQRYMSFVTRASLWTLSDIWARGLTAEEHTGNLTDAQTLTSSAHSARSSSEETCAWRYMLQHSHEHVAESALGPHFSARAACPDVSLLSAWRRA